MALYHKWDVKNDFAYVLQFFSLISDSLGSVKLVQILNDYLLILLFTAILVLHRMEQLVLVPHPVPLPHHRQIVKTCQKLPWSTSTPVLNRQKRKPKIN